MKTHLVYCVRVHDSKTGIAKVHTPAESLAVREMITVMEHERRIRVVFPDGSVTLVKPDEIVSEED